MDEEELNDLSSREIAEKLIEDRVGCFDHLAEAIHIENEEDKERWREMSAHAQFMILYEGAWRDCECGGDTA